MRGFNIKVLIADLLYLCSSNHSETSLYLSNKSASSETAGPYFFIQETSEKGLFIIRKHSNTLFLEDIKKLIE